MHVFETRAQGALVVALCAFALLSAPPAHAAAADSTNTPPLPIELRIDPAAPCAGDTVSLVAINPCNPCNQILFFGRTSDGHLRLEFSQMLPAACSTLPCSPERAAFELGAFAAGHFTVNVEVVWHLPPDSMSTSGHVLTTNRLVTFDVGQCTSKPLPFVDHVVIGGPAPCVNCPPEACPDRPVVLGLQGALPDPCWRLLGFEVLPLMSPSGIPVARLTVREPDPNVDCPGLPQTFSVGTSLPPQAPGPHRVEIQVAIRAWNDSTALRIASQEFGYVVKDSCPVTPPPTACAWPFLEPVRVSFADSLPPGPAVACDLNLAPGTRGSMLFAARSEGVPLAGLQGEIGASPFLKVLNVQAAGAASGMTLNWTPKDNGASWVLYTGSGAPIPGSAWVPVLLVTVAADSALHDPQQGLVYGSVIAASDSLGTGVPICPLRTLVVPGARVCVRIPPSCDANGDGLSNVADLVRMVRCILDPANCPDTVAARPDCNGDGGFHIDDIFCCARAILGGPHEGGGRGPGSLRFAFTPPVMDGTVLHVSLQVTGAGDLGAALLRIDYPGDRWIATVEPGLDAPALSAKSTVDYVPLVEPGVDDVVVALLRLDPSAPTEMTVSLTFRLRPGASPGGQLTVGSSEMSAQDGTPIAIDLGGLETTLDAGVPAAPARVALSRARPNPSTGETRFVVSLPEAGEVDLAVYDLAGRRVATLWQGALPAGSREFAWNPARVPSGVYFTRLVVNGEVRSSRVTLRLAR